MNRFDQDIEFFIQTLQKWGKIHNFTKDLDTQSIYFNIQDSLYPLEFIDEFETLADIGTGVGYPGLILSIANRDKKIYLIEPKTKRVAFLNFIKANLKLQNLTIYQDRIENIDNLKVDIITSRAVTKVDSLIDISSNIAKDDTKYLFYKGSSVLEELESLQDRFDYQINTIKNRNFLYIKGKRC